MTTSKQEKIDRFLLDIESISDIRYQINKERDLGNHYYVFKTLVPEYKIAKEKCSDSLKELLDIKTEE